MWKIAITKNASKQLNKLDKQVSRAILSYLSNNIASLDNPKILGKQLKWNLGNLWRYRVSDYRILCEIHDETITVIVVNVGHRKDIYDN